MGSKTKVTWQAGSGRSDDPLVEARRVLSRNAEAVGMFLSGAVVKSISIGQPVRRVIPRKGSLNAKRRRLIGLSPSSPGEPPRVLHGALRRSINHRVDRYKNKVSISVGAYTKYARALELGNPRGRLKPRPYLRPALYGNEAKIKKTLAKGLFR